MELCPVKPVDTVGNTLTGPDGTVTKWCPHGVEQQTPDGTIKFWWKKPTLKEMFESKAQSIYVRFHSDDSVSYRIGGAPYYWSAPQEAPPCVGTWSWTEYCDETFDDHMYKPYCSGAHCSYCGYY